MESEQRSPPHDVYESRATRIRQRLHVGLSVASIWKLRKRAIPTGYVNARRGLEPPERSRRSASEARRCCVGWGRVAKAGPPGGQAGASCPNAGPPGQPYRGLLAVGGPRAQGRRQAPQEPRYPGPRCRPGDFLRISLARPTRKLLDAARRAASGSCGPRVPHKTLTPMSRFTAQAASNLAVKREILRIAPRCRGLAAGPAARRRGAGRSAGLPGRDARCGQHGPVRGRQGRRPRQRRGADLRLRARRNALRVVPRLTPRRARHALEPSTDDDDLTGVKDETVAAVQREVLRQRLLVFAKIRQRRIRVQREADDSSWQVGGRPEVSC